MCLHAAPQHCCRTSASVYAHLLPLNYCPCFYSSPTMYSQQISPWAGPILLPYINPPRSPSCCFLWPTRQCLIRVPAYKAGLLWSLIPFTNYPPPTQASSGLCTGSSLCIECSYSRSSHGWLPPHHLGLRSPGSPPQRLCSNTIYRRTPRLLSLKLAFVVGRKTKKEPVVI